MTFPLCTPLLVAEGCRDRNQWNEICTAQTLHGQCRIYQIPCSYPAGRAHRCGTVELKEGEVGVCTSPFGPIGESWNSPKIDPVSFNSTWYGAIGKAEIRGCLRSLILPCISDHRKYCSSGIISREYDHSEITTSHGCLGTC